MKINKSCKSSYYGAALLAALFFFSETAQARGVEPLYLYAAPSKGGRYGAPKKKAKPAGTAQSGHDHAAHDREAMKKKKPSGRPAYGGKIKGLKKHEPSMRPTPIRSYILSDKNISEDAETFLMRPDGTMGEARIVRDKGQVKVVFENTMGDGPGHGANNVYVVEKKVKDGTLVIRTAKWINIHHSCGWGHDHRYNEQRNRPQSLDSIPLEITFDKLWSGNLHADVLSGEKLSIEALHYGKPAAGTIISVTTEKQWTKRMRTDAAGKTSFRLIEDYFSDDWSKFKRRNAGAFTVVARYNKDETGEYKGQKYNKVSMVTSFHWKYNPAMKGYMSYSAGLYAGIFTIGIGGLGIFYYRQRKKKPMKETHLDEKA